MERVYGAEPADSSLCYRCRSQPSHGFFRIAVWDSVGLSESSLDRLVWPPWVELAASHPSAGLCGRNGKPAIV